MIPHKQLSLADIFRDCQEDFQNDIHKLMIEELFSALMLSRFSFVSYEYVDPDEGIFDIIG